MEVISGDSGRSLLVIDQVPLFEASWEACRLARESIHELRAEIRRFETRDAPAYERWFNATFGKLLTDIREASEAIIARDSELKRLKKRHWARFFGGAPAAARAGMAFGFAAGLAEEEAEGFHEVSLDEEEGNYGPEHEDYRFEEGDVLQDGEVDYGEDPESVRMFEELFVRQQYWKRNSYRSRRYGDEDEPRRPGAAGGATGGGNGAENGRPAGDPASAADSLRSRLKERYRLLAKKLHPDVNSELTPEEKSLWNQVQAAYQERNLEQLDVLLALSDVISGAVTPGASLSQLRRATLEVERLVAPLRRKIEELRLERAWNFSVRGDRDTAALRQAIEKEFLKDLLELHRQLAKLEREIVRFSRSNARPEPAEQPSHEL